MHSKLRAEFRPLPKSGVHVVAPPSGAAVGEVLYPGKTLIVGELGSVCLALWRAKPTAETFLRQKAALESVVGKNPGQVAFLCVILADTPPPDETIRRASAQMISEHQEDLAKVACVIEGQGFRAAATRLVLSGIGLVMRSPAQTKYFDRISQAARWIAPDVSPSADDLAQFAERMRGLWNE